MPRVFHLLPPIAGTALLVATFLLLLLQLVRVMDAASSDTIAVEAFELPKNDASNAIAPTLRGMRPNAYYDAVTDRPLFAPQRRPFEPAVVVDTEPQAPEPVAVEEPQPIFRLKGVMNIDGGYRALVESSAGVTEWIEEKNELSGWVIEEIGPDWVEIKKNESSIRLDMYP